jgi:hypothetical protein
MIREKKKLSYLDMKFSEINIKDELGPFFQAIGACNSIKYVRLDHSKLTG